MKENWSSTHFYRISPREKEVACKQSAMYILHFYLVGQILLHVSVWNRDICQEGLANSSHWLCETTQSYLSLSPCSPCKMSYSNTICIMWYEKQAAVVGSCQVVGDDSKSLGRQWHAVFHELLYNSRRHAWQNRNWRGFFSQKTHSVHFFGQTELLSYTHCTHVTRFRGSRVSRFLLFHISTLHFLNQPHRTKFWMSPTLGFGHPKDLNRLKIYHDNFHVSVCRTCLVVWCASKQRLVL